MSTGMLLQYVIIGLIVLASLLLVVRKLAPTFSNRWMATASIRCNQPHRRAWVRALGRRLQPKQATGDCSDGCATCGACGPKPPRDAQVAARPLNFRARSE